MKAKVKCIKEYFDLQLLTNEKPTRITPNEKDKNYIRLVTTERANELVDAGVCELVEVVEPKNTKLKPKIEKAIKNK